MARLVGESAEEIPNALRFYAGSCSGPANRYK
jgi:hypothetical protein